MKEEIEERNVGGGGDGREDGGRNEEMEERMVGGMRKWKRGWWEEEGNGREVGGMKEGMEERM